MTIDEIKSVSILQWMRENNYGDGVRKGRNYFFCSPLRSERTPSFAVNPAENLWCDFGDNRNGGNLINLVEQLNPTWSEHQVLAFLEQQIRELNLDFTEDYNARIKEEEEKQKWKEGKQAEREEQQNHDTVVEMVIPLSHPFLRDYVIQRRIDFNIAQRYCKEVHYSLYGNRYYAIAFMNIANGMETRNKLYKRCIGKKTISTIYQLLMGKDSNLDAQAKKELSQGVFASTGGNPSSRQLEGLIQTAKDATFHIGFDMDDAGKKFVEQFKELAEKANVPSNRIVREEPSDGYKDFNDELLANIARRDNPLAKENVKDELREYVDSFRKHPDDIPSVKDVLHPNDGQVDLLPKALWKLYAHYETLYEDAYTMQHSCLVAPEDKEEIKAKAIEAGETFKKELADALGVKEEAEDDEKKVSAGVDLDSDGSVEINESEETKHHGMRR